MRINSRITNWRQVLGVILLCNAAGSAAFCVADPSLQVVAFGYFSLWMGIRLWTIASKPAPVPPSSV